MSTAIWAERRFCVSRLDRSAEGRESVSALREISQPTSKRRAVPTGDVKRGRRAISQQVKDAQRLAESGQRRRPSLCPCDCCSLRAAARAHKDCQPTGRRSRRRCSSQTAPARAAQRRSLWGSLAPPFRSLGVFASSASVSAVPLRSSASHPGALRLHHGTRAHPPRRLCDIASVKARHLPILPTRTGLHAPAATAAHTPGAQYP